MSRKLYISPTCGRSQSLPAEFRQFFQEEPCEYRSTFSKAQMQLIGAEILDSGREKVTKTVTTFDGEEEYTSFDHPGVRYYVEIDDFEGDLEALILATGKRVILERRDPENQFQQDYVEAIYGLPSVAGEWTAELELDEVPAEAYEREDTEGWI